MRNTTTLTFSALLCLLGGLISTNLPAQQKEVADFERRVAEINESNRVTGIVNEGIDLYHRNNPSAALARFQEAMNQGYRSPDIHFFLGMSHAALGQAYPALTELDRYLQLEPNGEFVDQALQLVERISDQLPDAAKP